MSTSEEIRLSGIIYESLVNGPGIRRVLFSQGCIHSCKNCFNESTHSFDGGELINMNQIIKDIVKNPILNGVTFSGGDPLEQAGKFAYIAKEIKKVNLDIWCYTGYTFEYILHHQSERNGWSNLLKYIDVLVDGKFEEGNKNDKLKYRGSSNQRIIDVQKSLSLGNIHILNYD